MFPSLLFRVSGILCLLAVGSLPIARAQEDAELLSWLRGDEEAEEVSGTFSLEQCVQLALKHNYQRPASRFAVAIARAQHRQALSAYWPQVSLNAVASLRSDEPNFLYPETTFSVPDMMFSLPEMNIPFPGGTIQTPASALTIPAGAFGPGFPPAEINVPVPPQNVEIPAQAIAIPSQQMAIPGQEYTVPEQEINLMDRFTYGALLEVKWLLFDGGMRRSMRRQAKQGVAAAREDARRSDLEIVYDVTRMYEGAVLARQLVALGTETLSRMDATLALTEKLYQGGSMQVKKTDYLRNKVIVQHLRTLVERLRKNEKLALSALVHSMGLSWQSEIIPLSDTIETRPFNADLGDVIREAFVSSPQWQKLNIGITAAAAKVREERSHFLPKVALMGSAHHYENNLNSGSATDSNLEAWSVGVGMELPLFTGFRATQKVHEAKARLAQIQAQKSMLRQGLAMQIKSLYLGIEEIGNQETILNSAVETAQENRDLTERAYQNDMIEAQEVFEAQMMEAYLKARQEKLRYDQVSSMAQLDLVVGRDVLNSSQIK